MNTIVILVVVILLIVFYLVLRYVLNFSIVKIADFLTNTYAHHKNDQSGPIVEKLADLYPDMDYGDIESSTEKTE